MAEDMGLQWMGSWAEGSNVGPLLRLHRSAHGEPGMYRVLAAIAAPGVLALAVGSLRERVFCAGVPEHEVAKDHCAGECPPTTRRMRERGAPHMFLGCGGGEDSCLLSQLPSSARCHGIIFRARGVVGRQRLCRPRRVLQGPRVARRPLLKQQRCTGVVSPTGCSRTSGGDLQRPARTTPSSASIVSLSIVWRRTGAPPHAGPLAPLGPFSRRGLVARLARSVLPTAAAAGDLGLAVGRRSDAARGERRGAGEGGASRGLHAHAGPALRRHPGLRRGVAEDALGPRKARSGVPARRRGTGIKSRAHCSTQRGFGFGDMASLALFRAR